LPTPRREIIIFDLDDTLLETYDCLITPLEYDAVEKMCAAGLGKDVSDQMAEELLRLRKSHPENIEEMLIQRFSQIPSKAIRTRRTFLSNACKGPAMRELLRKIFIDHGVKRLLQNLSKDYILYLLTIGPPDFQNAKIDYLNIRYLFDKV